MKVALQNYRTDAPNFKGIRPTYQNGNGFTVIPIEKDPKQKEINSAIETTKKGKGYEGMNGVAYMYGEDLVVKKYKKMGEALSYNPMREIGALDKLYENKKTQQGNQNGLYAVQSPDGTYYLVSTRVKGDTIRENPNILNRANLTSLAEKIEHLDAGMVTKGENNKQLIQRPMHYDLSNGNIKFDDKTAGIFDYEYMGEENLDTHIMQGLNGRIKSLNPHISDILNTPSNLRSFEHRTLYGAITNADDPKKTFEDYLSAKSKYYADLEKDLPNTENKELCREYKRRCRVHSKMLQLALENPRYKDVKTAEAMKIQISRWVFEASESSAFGNINPKQIEDYVAKAQQFLYEHYEQAEEGSNEQLYYEDSLKLVGSWDVLPWSIYATLKEPDEGLPEKEYQKAKRKHEKLLRKVCDKKITTLDKLVTKRPA